ncbi:MAG: hypothetical protein GY906_29420 [bacterium]|nr:hypothetical protein [bacterium]
MNAATLAEWLLTYAIHSTLLLGFTWILGRILNDRHLALQEFAWRTALIGAFLTATLQVGLGVQPLTGQVYLSDPGPSVTQPATTTGSPESLATLSTKSLRSSVEGAENLRSSSSEPVLSTPSVFQKVNWTLVLPILWGFSAAIAIASLLRTHRRLRQLLADRRSLPGHTVRRLATAMGVRRQVRVSLTSGLDMPCATGILNPEICVPTFVVTDLPAAEQECLFAHEMAHVARFDTAWLLFYHVVEKLFLFQPLNRLARIRLQGLAECLSDDQAASCTGRYLELASCLVRVARHCSIPRPLAIAAAIASRSGLGRRVQRLMRTPARDTTYKTWMISLLPVAMITSAIVLPGVSLPAAVAPAPPITPAADFAPTPPTAPIEVSPAKPAPVAPSQSASMPSQPGTPAPFTFPLPEGLPSHQAAPIPPSPPDAAELIEAKVNATISRQSHDRKIRKHIDAEIARISQEVAKDIEIQLAAVEAGEADIDEVRALVQEQMKTMQLELEELAQQYRAERGAKLHSREEARRQARERRPSREELEQIRAEITVENERVRREARAAREEARAQFEQRRHTEREARAGVEPERIRVPEEARRAQREAYAEAREASRIERDEARARVEREYSEAREEVRKKIKAEQLRLREINREEQELEKERPKKK